MRNKENGFALLLIGVVCGFAISCSPASAPPLETLEAISDPKAKMSFTMGNREIRQDIITALDEQNIEHWTCLLLCLLVLV